MPQFLIDMKYPLVLFLVGMLVRDFTKKAVEGMSERNCSIINAMCNYASRKSVRMHMPGHKGKKVFLGGPSPEPAFEWAQQLLDEFRVIDMTESPGLDNLHYATGCIREVERKAESLFGSSRTYLLVNGATSGVQASMIAARMTLGSGIVALPRNVHKSTVTAIAISGFEPEFIDPEFNRNLGGYLPLDEERLEKVLEQALSRRDGAEVRAVLVINPTYCGFARDLSRVSDLVHSRGAMLIVDEAHGTHFKIGRTLPPSALECGADLVVHGAHKTTVAYTQTALLHVGKSAPERFPGLLPSIEEALRTVQTTSPSYLLMASLEQAIDVLAADDGLWVQKGMETAREITRRLKRIPGLSVAGCDPSVPVPDGLMHDPCRILVNLGGLNVTGPEAARFLSQDMLVYPEMTGPEHLLMIWTGADGEDEVNAVEVAFKELSVRYRKKSGCDNELGLCLIQEAPKPRWAMGLREAFLSVSEPVPIENAVGRVSADTVVIYPPGSPLITPGERFDREIVEYILEASSTGLNVLGRGIGNGQDVMMVYCTKLVT